MQEKIITGRKYGMAVLLGYLALLAAAVLAIIYGAVRGHVSSLFSAFCTFLSAGSRFAVCVSSSRRKRSFSRSSVSISARSRARAFIT